MRISMDMTGLNIVLMKEEITTVDAGIELTKSEIGTELYLSHNALRKIEEAIGKARSIQRSSLINEEGNLITIFTATI